MNTTNSSANTDTNTALGGGAPNAGASGAPNAGATGTPNAGTQTANAQQAASGGTNGAQGQGGSPPPANTPQNGTQADQGGGTQASATALGAPPAAQTIEVTVPEGVEVHADLLEAVKAAAKDSASAQKLVNTYLQAQQAQMEKFRQQHEQRKANWLQQLKTDPEFGGEKYEANLQQCHRVLEKFGDQELLQLFNDTGLGNMPAMVKFVHRIAKVLSEDTIAGTVSSTGGRASQDPFLSIYTSMQSK